MTVAEELAELREKLMARKGQPGYTQAVKDIEARIAELEAQNGD